MNCFLTNEDIKNSVRGDPQQCAIAHSINRTMHQHNIRTRVYINSTTAWLITKEKKKLGKTIYAINFKISLPDRVTFFINAHDKHYDEVMTDDGRIVHPAKTLIKEGFYLHFNLDTLREELKKWDSK